MDADSFSLSAFGELLIQEHDIAFDQIVFLGDF